jgi:hypothetical protein
LLHFLTLPEIEHIGALEKHIREMYRELVVEFNIKKDTTRALDDALMKVKGQSTEIRGYINKLRASENEVAAMQSGLHNLVKYTDPKDYEAATRDLYRNFVKKEKGGGGGMRASSKKKGPSSSSEGSKKEGKTEEDNSESNDNGNANSNGPPPRDGAAEEASRQRDYMERTVHTLKKTLRLAGQRMSQKSQMSMSENTVLINECNLLRRENYKNKQKIAEQVSTIRDLSNQLGGPPGSRNGSVRSLHSASMASSMHSSHGGGSRVLDSRPTTSQSIDPRNILNSRETRGGMNSANGLQLPADIKEGSEWEEEPSFPHGGGSTTSLPRPESTTQSHSRRLQVSTADARGSTAKKVPSRNVSTASLGGSSEHLRPSSKARNSRSGKVIRGSTRPIMEAATARSKVQGMLNELDDNNRLIEMQRIEIGRLREQVQILVESTQQSGQGISRGGVIGTDGRLTETYLIQEANNGSMNDMPPAFVMSSSQSQPALENRR